MSTQSEVWNRERKKRRQTVVGGNYSLNPETVKNIPQVWKPGILLVNLATDPSVVSVVSGPRRTVSAQNSVVLDGRVINAVKRAYMSYFLVTKT